MVEKTKWFDVRVQFPAKPAEKKIGRAQGIRSTRASAILAMPPA